MLPHPWSQWQTQWGFLGLLCFNTISPTAAPRCWGRMFCEAGTTRKSSQDAGRRSLFSGPLLFGGPTVSSYIPAVGGRIMSGPKDPSSSDTITTNILIFASLLTLPSKLRSEELLNLFSGIRERKLVPQGFFPKDPAQCNNGGPVSERARGHRLEGSVVVGLLKDSGRDLKIILFY